MNLYKASGNKLDQIEKEPFKAEKDIQSLIEANVETLFGLQFVSTEFSIGRFRLDSLCFNEETKAFVIIEYKKGSSYSVIDQGYSYLSTMLNNKADFILEYNEKTEKPLRKDQVDWPSSRVIFIASSFNSYQKNSVNFKDLPFELWEIKQFSNSTVALDQIQSDSQESIIKVAEPNSQSYISKVSSEIKVPKEEDHVKTLSDQFAKLWSEFRERLDNLDDISFYATKFYVGCKKGGAKICHVHFMKNSIRITIVRGHGAKDKMSSRNLFTLEDPKKIAKEDNWENKTGNPGYSGYSYHIYIESLDDLDYTMYLINQKYKSLA